ncbi:MAG: hypothetical protein HOV78_20380 [Hamadaea sp.]|nr:hypothetical protein [Hamadaea sp.]NUO90639.1 hypothetical protein [Dermatophilaceae bacterium]
MTTQQQTSTTAPAYVGKHRPTVPSWKPSPEYGEVPEISAGVGLTLLGNAPHLTLVDLTGGMVRIPLTPEDVEHIVAKVTDHRAELEVRYAEQERQLEALGACVCETGVGVAACPVHEDYDPTDAELTTNYWPVTTTERHAAARDLERSL